MTGRSRRVPARPANCGSFWSRAATPVGRAASFWRGWGSWANCRGIGGAYARNTRVGGKLAIPNLSAIWGLAGRFLCGLRAGGGLPDHGEFRARGGPHRLGGGGSRRGLGLCPPGQLRHGDPDAPSDPLTYYGLGEAYRSKGLLPEAEDYLLLSLSNSASPQDHNYQTATLTLAAVYIQMERYPEAEALCQILIDDPTYARPWIALTNRGWAEYKSGRFLEAQDSYEEALDFRSDYAPAHFNLGKLDQSQSRWLSAVRQLELASESKQMSPRAQAEAHFRMGEIYITLDLRDKAIEQFRAAAEKAPQHKWGTDSRTYLDMLL
ncbi:MAG TPA: tetratricopeptide repeat protein [Myxococcales bacterium]|nr:tetratricopeptide repeat protein [Myxococcales bacterium]